LPEFEVKVKVKKVNKKHKKHRRYKGQRGWYNWLVRNRDKLKLNKEQKKAITHGGGPLLVIAGAGTGKTTVIAERIKYLISKKQVKPEEILGLTFTEKAALEMEERVDVVLPYGYTQMWISTFHSFCDRVLRDEAIHIGLNPDFALLSEAESLLFLRNNLFKLNLNYFRPLTNPNKFLGGLLNHFNRLRDEDIKTEEYLEYAASLDKRTESLGTLKETEGAEITKEEKDKTMELARAYRKYEELKVKEGAMDFADLIAKTLKLFRERKNILKEYQKRFKYILIDEFQDTNIAQNELVNLLSGNDKNLTVVADDDQSIYKWRGAAVSNVIQFKITYPRATLVVLTKNYRSTQKILDSAYKLIQNNNPDRLEVKERVSKKLQAVRKDGGAPIEFIPSDRVENEAEKVAKEIKRLTPKPYQYKEIAILVRANNHSDPFIQALIRYGIPYQFLGPGQLFRQGEVKDLIAYLKVLYNFEDNVAFYRVLYMEIFDLSARDIAALLNFSRKRNISLFETCEALVENGAGFKISRKTKEILVKLVKMIHRHLSLVPKETAGQILYYFLVDTGLLEKLAQYKTKIDERKAQNISKFFDKLRSYEVDHEDASIHTVVDWIALKMELGESPLATDVDWVEENKVNILTVHSAKGLEFPVVFLVNLVSQRFPTVERGEPIPIPEELIKEILPEGDSHLEEERRLFYVGMTRAKDILYFTAANYYGERKREKKISPFVFEALGKIKERKSPEDSQLFLFDWPKSVGPEIAEMDLSFSPSAEWPKNGRAPICYLSYSQIETFDRCPLQYKYKNILRIPVPKHFAASFGSMIHNTLAGFYRLMLAGKVPTWKDLFSLYRNGWVSEGYLSKKHEMKIFERGRLYLKKYFMSEFNPKIKTIATEKDFKIPINPQLRVGGRIDRIDEIADGTIEITDYKTGKVQTQKAIDKDLQMTLYAMAAVSPTGMGKNPEQVNLSFYFFEDGKKISTKRNKEQLKKAREEILKKAKEIEKSNFPPRPADPFPCKFCEFRLICEAWR
jgi:DNA helicase-2/ATP-dependent DNA helicase PcrA